MKKFLALASLFVSSLVFAQPANDNCTTAQAIGALPTPAGCPSGAGSNTSVSGTLNGATAANPYTYQGTGCTGSSTTMASPANDVWYTFVATGYQLNLTLSSTFANPNVAVYSGTCASLGGGVGGCAVGTAGGSASLTVTQMVIGQTYYVQVSGNSSTATGTFTMTLNNSIDCNNCLGASNLTVTPPPTNGMYQPGTTVSFCFKINSYSQVNTNWLHGVQLAFGSGWNLGSLTTSPPPACQGSGYWAYYPNGITDNAGQTWPSGFYFETVTGQNNPGNNFGDNCSGTISGSNWNFCFSITTAAACSPGSNLSVTINTSGDGESGSWSSLGCSGDPATNFNAIGSCCPPVMAMTPVSCNGGSDGTTTATPVGTQSPFTYTWSPSGGNSATASNLPAGTYTVSVIDKNNCLATNTVTVTQPAVVTLTLTPANPSCGATNGSVTATAGGGTPAYTYQINNGGYGASSSFTNLGAGTYTVDVQDSKGCVKTATVTLTAPVIPTVTVNSATTCPGGSATLTAGGATTYTWSPGTGLSATTGATVTATPGSTTVYTVTGTASSCTAAATATVTVTGSPTITVNTGTICVGQGSATLTATGASVYSWSPATGLSASTGSTVIASPAATTNYTITGSIGSCTAVATTTVSVNPLPAVSVNTASICTGQQTATLTASGADTYSWNPLIGLSASTGSSVTASPSSTTNYTVTGADVNGCVNTATTSVLVNQLPNVNVNSGLICQGASMTLNANGASSYSWTPATGLSASSGASVTANPGSTSVYSVTGTDANGCYSTAAATVVVVSNPTVSVTSGTICLGQGSAPLVASGATSYAWTPPTGLSSTSGSSVQASPNATTVYTVTGTAGTCTAVATTTVVVNPLPNITASSNSPVCVNQTLNLNAGNGIGYSWSGPDNFSSLSQNPSITGVTIAAAGTYTVTGVDANTCFNTATVTVVVNPLPVVTAGGATVCEGQNFSLNATPANASAYSWSGPLAYASNQQNPVITSATPGMAGPYVVTVTDANGCVNANVAQVVVNALPVVTANSGTLCAGQTTATLNASGANTFSWANAAGLSATTGATVIAEPASTTVYTVTGTDVNGCQNIATATVTVNQLPVVAVGPQNMAGCAPLCVSFTSNTTSSGNCSWVYGDGGTSLSCSDNHCYTVAGNYNVQLTFTDGNGCVSTASASVSVYPVPDADFSASPQPTTILEPTIQFYNNSGGAVIVTNNWTFGDYSNTNTSSLQSPVHIYGDTGSYAVQLVVISNYGCRDSVVKIIRIDDDYALYVPNAFSPNADGTNDIFKAIGLGIRDFKMYIFDRWGNQVFYSEKIDKGWDGTFQAKGGDVVQEDVYVWKIEAKSVKGDKKLLAGTVSLIK